MNYNVIILSGPTASGKTSTSIKLAKLLIEEGVQSVIVNFDSLLFYSELNVGTAKPTNKEMGTIQHEMINIVSAKHPMNASIYKDSATRIVNEHIKNGKLVILVGGSGFYLRALIKGMYKSPTTSIEVKKRVENIFLKGGTRGLLNILQEHDVESFNVLHENDKYRIIRAVEHYFSTGTKYSVEKKIMDELDPYNYTKSINKKWIIKHIHLDLPKDKHQKIIEERTNKMFKDGLVREVKSLLEDGFNGSEKPLQSIGYKEVLEFLDENNTVGQEACIERIIISTRQLAKSQRTWFKRSTNKDVFNPLEEDYISQIHKSLFSNEN
jgi:tRNA dimethylallyltransferase